MIFLVKSKVSLVFLPWGRHGEVGNPSKTFDFTRKIIKNQGF